MSINIEENYTLEPDFTEIFTEIMSAITIHETINFEELKGESEE